MNKFFKISLLVVACFVITACGGNRKHVHLNIHSDPLGAYTMIQVKYKGTSDADWVYLGTTPINIDRSIPYNNATAVSIKVIRSGFHDSIKTWKIKDFLKEYKKNKKILWVSNMVEQ